jgi:hypothetical protein
MTGTSTIPEYTGGARQTAERSASLGTVVIVALIGVLAIGVLALVLGFTGSNDFVDNIRDNVPGLEVSSSDGWSELDDPSGGFIAEMPEDREKKFVQFAPAANGRLDQWSSVIGSETDLTISYGKVSPPAGQSAKAALVDYADMWATTTLGGKVDKTAETTFRGYDAIELDVRNLTYDNQTATARALLFLKGETLYVIQSLSVYPDHPQYGRLVNSFQFTA